ncbi:protein phosphatase 1 regulatory subunit 36-like [Spodoptera litura]|uniref:Protein phosphatase 1 regulatory subunit 36-like n=1 Tax=Spodoptera litura TaxID=69820 RepID=A0A9J7EF60_SPOLT|nr:protein phosphatase 1 regulatory subunit 36-like [Spodoptera litura]
MTEDDDFHIGLYENGHWAWNDRLEQMIYVSHRHPQEEEVPLDFYLAPTNHMQFREDVDLVEQMRYRRHFQRKLLPGHPDIISLQDIKDLVIYTAPVNFLSSRLINMLHTPTGERFLRALVLYCAYSLQVTEQMVLRNLELETKIRTTDSGILEDELRDNLSDIRVLVAKEYCVILTGADDMKPFHHMGPMKDKRSLPGKDARTFDIFVRLCVQIVYLALGRRNLHQIEIETHRILKSEAFNANESKSRARPMELQASQSKTQQKQPAFIQDVIYGKCFRHHRGVFTHSPLLNEIFCPARPVDYRMLGLAVTKYPQLTPRLEFLRMILAGSDKDLVENNIIVGIIGMPRDLFDIMLRFLPPTSSQDKSKSGVIPKMSAAKATASRASSMSAKKSTYAPTYPEIVIPPKTDVELTAPEGFIDEPDVVVPVNEVQRKLWLRRFKSMMKLLKQKRR